MNAKSSSVANDPLFKTTAFRLELCQFLETKNYELQLFLPGHDIGNCESENHSFFYSFFPTPFRLLKSAEESEI